MTVRDQQPAPDPEEDPQPRADDEFDVERAKAKIAKANAEAAALRKRLKEAEEKATKYDELQDSERSELEKAAERIAAAEAKAQEAELALLRYEVGADKGLTPAQAKRLTGTTREELESDADELREAFGGDDSKKPTPPPSRRPVPHLRGGLDPEGDDDVIDAGKVADSILSESRL